MKKTIAAVFMAGAIAPVFAEESKALMQGFPPTQEMQVNRDNFMLPPYNRWAFQHIRELQPTREVSRGSAATAELEEAPLELADRSYKVSGDRQLSLDKWLEEAATDSFLVLHKGKIAILMVSAKVRSIRCFLPPNHSLVPWP